MSENTPIVPVPGAAQDAFALALDGLLAAMSAEQARVLRLSAVPHWLDAALLAELLGNAADTQHALDLLRPLRLVSWEPDGRFRIHDAARPQLRRQLRAADPPAWQAANVAAWRYFGRRSAATHGERPLTEQVEALYHQLVVDEPAGLAELARLFDEAVWNHQLGLAERTVRVAAEQDELLSATAGSWIRYYEARLAQLLRVGDGGTAVFADLAKAAADPRLVAAAQLGLAQGDVAAQRWQLAVQRLRTAHSDLRQAGMAGPDLARVALALGDAYRDLALRSGGFGFAAAEPQGLWYRLRLLPYLAVRGMARRWRRAPNLWWWHAGMDYQDWIIAWLLERAQGWYRKADADFGATDARGRVDAATALADIQRQLGRWSAARDGYRQLLADGLVAKSPYATARTELGLGAVLSDAGDLAEARQRLTAAGEVFRRFADTAGVAAVGMALGQVAERSGAVEEAVAAYAEAVPALSAAGDLLAATEVDARLAALAAGGSLGADARHGVDQTRAGVSERHYLARFSGSLLVLFRRLAVYVVTPIAFVVGTLLLGIALLMATAALETDVQLWARGLGSQLPLVQHAMLLAAAGGLALAALWFYPFLHGLLGLFLVRFLGGHLVRIEREQPARVVLAPDGIRLHDGSPDGVSVQPWATARAAEVVDVRTWRRPIHLMSRTAIVGAGGEVLKVEGITARYETLQGQLGRRLPATAVLRRHDYHLLPPQWVFGVLALSVALVALATALGVIGSTEAEVTPFGSSVPILLSLVTPTPMFYLFVTVILLLTTVTHWRLVISTRRMRQVTGLQLGVISPMLLALAALLWTVISLLWLRFMLTPA